MNQTVIQDRQDVVTLPAVEKKTVTRRPAVDAGFFDLQSFELIQRVAKGFAASSLVPKIYQGNSAEAIGNCMIALNLAMRTNSDPLMVMQNLTIVQGCPTWSSQFLIACVNTCGRFTALRFEFFGTQGLDDWGCRAWAIEKRTGKKLVGADITITLAKKEGWFGRNGSKWQTMTQQMLMYRAGAWWTRIYAPEISMGLTTADEAEDIIDLARDAYQTITERHAPQTIEARLDRFAGASEESEAATPLAAEVEGAHAIRAPEESASLESPPEPDADSIPDHLREATEKGRAARRSGHPREIPTGLHYKSKQPEAAAYLSGWDEEDIEMKAADNGTV